MSNHKMLSFVKSTIRLVGYFGGYLAFEGNWMGQLAFGILFASEVVGVIEEVDQP